MTAQTSFQTKSDATAAGFIFYSEMRAYAESRGVGLSLHTHDGGTYVVSTPLKYTEFPSMDVFIRSETNRLGRAGAFCDAAMRADFEAAIAGILEDAAA